MVPFGFSGSKMSQNIFVEQVALETLDILDGQPAIKQREC